MIELIAVIAAIVALSIAGLSLRFVFGRNCARVGCSPSDEGSGDCSKCSRGQPPAG